MSDSRLFVPGVPVMFEVAQLSAARYTTFFRGCKEDHYIILDHPYDDSDMPLPVKEGMKCVVRYLYEGKAYAFESTIQKISRYPFPFIFITYPKELEDINLRNAERYPIRIPAFFDQQALEGDVKNYPSGTLLDLSKMGCLLETSEPLELETLLFLAFALPNREVLKNITARVKRISRKENAYRLGLMFTVSENPEIEKIKEFLSHLALLQIQF